MTTTTPKRNWTIPVKKERDWDVLLTNLFLEQDIDVDTVYDNLDIIFEELQKIGNRRKKVLSIADNSAAPPTEEVGDRYVLDTTSETSHPDWDGAEPNDIAEFDGESWVAETPEEGWVCLVDDLDKDIVFINDPPDDPVWEIRPNIADHNDLSNIQGGSSAQYYHMTLAQHTDMTNKYGDLVYTLGMYPSATDTKSSGSPWTTDQVDDSSSAIGDILYINSSGNWERADANAISTCMGFAIAMEAGSGSKKLLLPGGLFRHDAWAWIPGSVLYVSASTLGAMAHTPPAGTGDYAIAVGVAKKSNVVMLFPAPVLVKIL